MTGLDLLSHVDEPARWIAGVVAGLVALLAIGSARAAAPAPTEIVRETRLAREGGLLAFAPI